MVFAGFEILGLLGLKRGLVALAPSVIAKTDSRMRIVAEEIKNAAVKLAPIEFGPLRGSAFVRRPMVNVLEIGFGKDYAMFVHEIPPDRAFHRPPTQWKYLETPAKARFASIDQDLEKVDASWGSLL